MPGLPIGWLGFWPGRRAPPRGIYSERVRGFLQSWLLGAEHRSPWSAASLCLALRAPACRSWAAPQPPCGGSHGLHCAGARGRPRAVPGAEPLVGGGRGEPQRERRLGPLVRLLRGPAEGRAAGRARAWARAGGGGEAASGRQRPRAGPDAEREHGLHRAPHADPHRAGGPQALQDRDAAPGLQLHLAPGQRPAAGRGLPGRAALLPRPLRRQGRGRPGRPAALHLHLLPQQPAQRGQSEGAWWERLLEGERGEPREDATEVS